MYLFNTCSDIQTAFDADLHRGLISHNGYSPNVTDKAALGYLLMLQTGDIDMPLDPERV